ncbi:hypothetical protein BD410DRAFT_475932 [Rickenella mellea]|uniref:Protein kinase domain-containing protein n=1 Tax=Rickenella mellea TaxID=50990 RepID=A0A4Y7QI31_9AGAM|nr:hypothetical protein BD410DRAFT_475932 [Rickenella mellea]
MHLLWYLQLPCPMLKNSRRPSPLSRNSSPYGIVSMMDVDKADKLNTPEKPASKDTSPKRQSMPRKAKEGGESTTDWEKQLRLVEEAVSKVFDTYNVDLALRPKLNKWLRHAINLTIQSWSQMVRHDLTYHLVSSSEVAWVIHRHRECQTASISGFFHPRDQPLLTHTGLVIRSYEDALVRLQEEKCSRTWVDPCRRHQQQEPKRREGDPDDHEKDERDNRRSGKRASNADPLPSAQGSQGGHSLSISELHLAFNWECLQSEGFSHMTRVIATDPPIEAGTMTTSTSDGSVKTSSSHGTVSSVPSLTMSTSQIASPLPVTPLDGSFASAQSEVLDMIGVESTSTSGKEVAVTISANEDESEAAVLDVQHASTHMFSKAGVVLDSLVANTSIGRVWSGNMVVEGLGQEKRVIVKMTTTDEGSEPILKEARIYEHLASQSIIPADAQYYGVFRSDNNSTALVLDDLGDALESFNHCSEEQKNALFDTALALHNSGVCHNDIEPRNVVVDQDGKVHIIDFHLATSDHSCPGADICGELTVLRNQLWLSH